MNSGQLDCVMQLASTYEGMSQELFKLGHQMEEVKLYNPSARLYSLVRCSEVSSVELRNLTARILGDTGKCLYEEVSSALRINVLEEKKWIRITVPAILPNRNARQNTLFLTRPLRECLIEFQRATPIERFGECAICIVHRYDEALGIRRVRDYDNIETKRYLDVIEATFLTNDSGRLCTVLQATEMGNRDCTEFYLMHPQTLPIWAQEHLKTHT
jgi:hypothetical protein